PFYGPHRGDAVNVFGYAASKGTAYSEGIGGLPTLYINQINKASINSQIGKRYNAISGTKLLIQRGEILPDLGDKVQPRTAVGLDRAGRRLIIVVIDGRQPLYSAGATLGEVAKILVQHGAYFGFNLDGGGSSTLVMAGEDGNAEQLNSPIHLGIQGNERPVGNHLGIYAKKVKE
ncbi:MAG: phosphodiester glycosidase family protein, partial [Chloroflexota bacterium]